MRRYSLIALLAAVVSLVASGGAQAVVVNMNAVGQSTIAFNPFDQSGYFGVAMVPGTRSKLAGSGVSIPTVVPSAPCGDPALTSDFVLPNTGLCWQGGSVIHSNETFTLVWDPNPHNAYTAGYVEQFLKDVSDGSGTFTSPYAVATQYSDASGHAAYSSLWGGAYDDYTPYPAGGGNSCQPLVSGTHVFAPVGNVLRSIPNDVCLTDAQLKAELAAEVNQNGLIGKLQPGHTPLIVLLMPPGVETCLDTAAHLCSANGDPTHVPGTSTVPAQFCSYHSQVTVNNVVFNYVVQPFTPMTGCDEGGAEQVPNPVDPNDLQRLMGQRLVSPLSQSELAASTDPGLNGWISLDGSEINDNQGCIPIGGPGSTLDSATVGSSGQNPYLLQREFNNAGVITSSPYNLPCSPSIALGAGFVVPSAVNQGDVVQFDGSKSVSSLLVPRANFAWDFGDGSSTVGPSAVHSYAKGGTYTVKLTVVDRGGNTSTLSQTISVLGPAGQPVTTGPGSGGSTPALNVRMQLMPQSLRSVLRGGVSIQVTSNSVVDGIVSISITRSAAKRAHIHYGRGPSVVIGRGTVSKIANGTVSLRLRLSRATALKLKHLTHVSLTVRLAVVAANGNHMAVDAAGRY